MFCISVEEECETQVSIKTVQITANMSHSWENCSCKHSLWNLPFSLMQNIYTAWMVHYMGLDVRKPVFGGLRTTQAQTSLRIYQSNQHLCYLLFGKYRM